MKGGGLEVDDDDDDGMGSEVEEGVREGLDWMRLSCEQAGREPHSGQTKSSDCRNGGRKSKSIHKRVARPRAEQSPVQKQ